MADLVKDMLNRMQAEVIVSCHLKQGGGPMKHHRAASF